MYIIVKYGNNESLICNPSCAVINLLASIKRRAGFGHTNINIDLSDETGLVKELDSHTNDYATKYLHSHRTYVLVEKQVQYDFDHEGHDGRSSPAPTHCQYIPLLDNYTELMPNYRLHVQQVDKKKKGRNHSKSPSPATRTKSKKSSQGPQRASSRRR